MRWTKDQKVEANFKSLGFHLEVERVKISNIDLAEGLRRQARLLGKLNQDYVLQLAIAMEQPEAAFPMCVMQKPPHGTKMWPHSGNHRLAAHLMAFPDADVIEVYTVTIRDPLMLDVIPRVVNAWESGLGFSKEEKIINARWMVEHHSMKMDDAARLFSIDPKWIYTAKRAEDVKAKLMDVPRVNGLANSILLKLAPLQENINVLKATAKILGEFHVRGDDAEQLINDVKTQNTELKRMSELGRWESLLKDRLGRRAEEKKAGKKNGKNSHPKATVVIQQETRKHFLRHLTGLAKLLQRCDTLEKLQCTSEVDKDLLYRSWWTVSTALNKIVKTVTEGGGK